ncbi:TonB-dependent receptor [Algivirga pacifica]|uniref:TonB-dependent receptor n=1 Tax=Algivirga pacifica TaxID=1162670 RepID=A0ABP9DH82_9BACT
MDFKRLATRDKALHINLDSSIYGSLAEIGAGQDVAAHFFKAGGASGTIAKTMSAYDMAFSDAIYGPEPTKRYVCQSRVEKMLDKEYRLLGARLPERASHTKFFAFANTVEQINFNRTNRGHGWLGIRFQLTPETPPNECIIHVQLKDSDPSVQQSTMGTLGVNLVYACFNYHQDMETFLMSLLDGLTVHHVAVDFFRITGPDFEHVDNRLMSLKLVKMGLTKATMFGPDGKVMLPADELYKKNILVLRGRFRPVTLVNQDILRQSAEEFMNDPEVDKDNIITIAELTLSNLRISENRQKDEQDFLDRVDLLCKLGVTVMISHYSEYYRLTNYLSRHTRGRKIGVAMGVYNLEYIFNPSYYSKLKGGILEAFGDLFGRNVNLYIYPSFKKGSEDHETVLTSKDVEMPPSMQHLYDYLLETGKIKDLEGYQKDHLHILSDDVLEWIKRGEDDKWEDMVPEMVAKSIKKHCLFDYPCSVEERIRITQEKKEENIQRQRKILRW